jgi:hypothetical protein
MFETVPGTTPASDFATKGLEGGLSFSEIVTFSGTVKVPMELKVRSAQILAAALRGIPGAEVKPVRQSRSAHPMVAVRTADHIYKLETIWAGEGWPSDVRQAIAPLPHHWPRQVVVTAKRLAPGSIRLLNQRDANWADEAGRARIVVPPGLLIVRETESHVEGSTPGKFRWSSSALTIAELILHRGLTELRTGDLAGEVPWSEGQVSQVLSGFDSQGWTVRHGGKSGRVTWREVTNRGSMLEAWAAHVGSEDRPKRLAHRAARDLLRFAETELRDALGWEEKNWALTSWAGLEVIAPFVTVVPVVHVYVVAKRFATGLDEIFPKAGLREVEEGARVEFWEADFTLITQPGQPSQIPVASTPRLYADLLALGGRGADAAQHLRETKLGF